MIDVLAGINISFIVGKFVDTDGPCRHVQCQLEETPLVLNKGDEQDEDLQPHCSGAHGAHLQDKCSGSILRYLLTLACSLDGIHGDMIQHNQRQIQCLLNTA